MHIAYRLIKKMFTRLRMIFHRVRLAQAGSNLVIEAGVVLEQADNISLGDGVRVARRSVLRANSDGSESLVVGPGTSIMENCVFSTNQGHITVGENSWFGPGCLLYGNAGLDIGADVLVAGHTAISTVSHRYDSLALPMNEQGLDCEPIRIEDDVWIGMNVSILKGITIGQGSIIGAGSVVTKDIPANSIAVGVPAKIVGRRDAASGETFLANEARRRVA